MNPKVLFVGGDKGSWEMRGKQIGAFLGARYAAKHITPEDWAWPDLVVLVKRAPEQWFSDITRHCKAPLIWDVLDFWRQPSANDWPAEELTRQVLQLARSLNISVLIGATQRMATHIGGLYVPHHHRLDLVPLPPRDEVRVVAYDGSPRYLGIWRKALDRVCADRGLTFVVNPADLRQADVLVAFRDREWDGWACQQWKSGIKYVNAIAAGRPILTQPCAAFHEIDPVGFAIHEPDDLARALDAISVARIRQRAYEDGLRREKQYRLQTIAARYHEIFQHAYARVSV